jgi:Na+/H+-translocating membrane pyrophosphatase
MAIAYLAGTVFSGVTGVIGMRIALFPYLRHGETNRFNLLNTSKRHSLCLGVK